VGTIRAEILSAINEKLCAPKGAKGLAKTGLKNFWREFSALPEWL
jgi:hypothetical protein